MSIRLFNTLLFERQKTDGKSGELKEDLQLKAYVPGVNSGAYEKALAITIVQVRPYKFWNWIKWKLGTKHVVSADITLSTSEMIQLRDEINQILRLPFKEAQGE